MKIAWIAGTLDRPGLLRISLNSHIHQATSCLSTLISHRHYFHKIEAGYSR